MSTVETNNPLPNQQRSKTSQSVDVKPKVQYKITPEEMWNCIKGSSQNWGIEGYEIAKKYFDYRQVLWHKKREKILKDHKGNGHHKIGQRIKKAISLYHQKELILSMSK